MYVRNGGVDRMNAETRYHLLFNSITDALEAMENLDFGEAKRVLVKAQQEAEEVYLSEPDCERKEDGSGNP